MIFRIESQHTNLITTENLDWVEKLDQLKSIIQFEDQNKLLNQSKIELGLSDEHLLAINKCFTDNPAAKYFRYSITNSFTFKIEPIYLNLNRFDGKLIYWKDWDYIFYQNKEEFCLWVYLGGMSDMWHKIILSKSQIEKYETMGFSEIDYLVKDIRNWEKSIEYKKAEKENRIIH